MNTEQKARAYDEVREKIALRFGSNVAEEVFSEFEMSEDEKVRKWLYDYFRSLFATWIHPDITCEEILAWLEKQGEHAKFRDSIQVGDKVTRNRDGVLVNLSKLNRVAKKDEKQGEQKPVIEMKTPEESLGIDSDTYNKIVDECIYGEQKPADEVKPKFHEGEWITNGDYTWKIVEVKPLDYILQSQDGNIVDDTISYVDEPFHLWTIEDAKDGDVLACESGWTCIFKTLVNDENFSSYCFMDNTKWFCETGSECHTLKEEFVKAYNGKIYPATKEQRDLLFQKMHEAGYMWDSKSKQLLSLKAEPSGKQKPAGWSEEDEKRLKSCLDILQPKTLLGNTETINTKWLKSLKQRIGWKPSEEQMKALDSVIDEYDGYPEFDSLVSLKNDLKKL